MLKFLTTAALSIRRNIHKFKASTYIPVYLCKCLFIWTTPPSNKWGEEIELGGKHIFGRRESGLVKVEKKNHPEFPGTSPYQDFTVAVCCPVPEQKLIARYLHYSIINI